MLGIGDIVAIAGRGQSMMVVDMDGRWVTVSWRRGPHVMEREILRTHLVLLRRAPWIVQRR